MIGADAELFESLWWDGAAIRYVDQRLLPHQYVIATAATVASVVDAIGTGAVYGYGSVDMFGAFGIALAGLSTDSDEEVADAVRRIRTAGGPGNRRSASARVAAVPRQAALLEAQRIFAEQRSTHDAIASNAAALIPERGNVVTHGSTGALATAGSGTAQGAIVAAARSGKEVHVFVCEGAPSRSGARLTAFELAQAGIPVTLIADSATAWIMRCENIAAVIVGAAAIAANGDTVAQLGTYGIALAAAHHGIPFYVAATRATVDLSLANGEAAAPTQPPMRSASVAEVYRSAIAGAPSNRPRDVALHAPLGATSGCGLLGDTASGSPVADSQRSGSRGDTAGCGSPSATAGWDARVDSTGFVPSANVTGRNRLGDDAGQDLLCDVTPGRLITAMISEYGIMKPPYFEAIRILMSRPAFALIDRARGESPAALSS